MGKFGSRSIAFRPKPTGTTYIPPKRRNEPFRFLDLPPELRDHILEIILLDSIYPLPLLLTCQQVYAEAASLFYHDVSLSRIQLGESFHPFLQGPFTRVSAWQHIQNLRVRFTMREKALFLEGLCAALRGMDERGRLQHLRIEIGSCFPGDEFWGWEELSVCHDIRVSPGKGKGQVISAPLFVTMPWFQKFIHFLDDSTIPKTSLYVDAEDHDKFWCMFHRAHPSGEKCDGWWKGKSKVLKISRSNLVKTLKGAIPVTPVELD
ncbi:hypothetical protein F4818DRAFT_134484 [Hypoxylon cercidicola]|nr:hypothetical protein F4818DRAFT_134484 [Hypoxylon cercidicola]